MRRLGVLHEAGVIDLKALPVPDGGIASRGLLALINRASALLACPAAPSFSRPLLVPSALPRPPSWPASRWSPRRKGGSGNRGRPVTGEGSGLNVATGGGTDGSRTGSYDC